MGGEDTTTKSEQITMMPDFQNALVKRFFNMAQNLMDQGGPDYYPGQTYAGPSENELAARRMMLDFAQGAGGQGVQNAIDANNYWLDPAMLDPTNFVGYSAVADDMERRAMERLNESYLPSIQDQFVNAGGIGGSRQGVEQALTRQRTESELEGALAGLGYNTAQYLGSMNQGARQLAPTLFSAGLMAPQLVEGVGRAERADEQQAIDADMARFNYEELQPYNLVDWARQVAGSMGTYGGTVKGKTEQEAPGLTANQVIGAGLMAASLFTGGATAPAGMAMMAQGQPQGGGATASLTYPQAQALMNPGISGQQFWGYPQPNFGMAYAPTYMGTG